MARKRPLLYGPDDKPLALTTGWDAASRDRRAKNWSPTDLSINALLSGDVDTIRRRARDEIRRNAWARKAQDSFVANLVGRGIRPKVQTDNEELERAIKDLWARWCEEADADGTCNFFGLQALITRAFSEGGDCFVRLRPRRTSDGLSVPLQLQVLEAEMVDPSKTELLAGGNVIRAGIEFDRLGRRRAYWMFRTHPGDLIHPLGAGLEAVPVPAAQVIHVFQVLRPGQIRGVPALATVLAMLHEIREVDDAHVVRAKIQNLYATFEEIPTEGSVLDPDQDGEDEDDVPRVTAAAGSHVVLPPGHTIKFGEPPSGNVDYEAFIRTKLRSVAAGAGVTYEQMSGDLTGVNFSSIRAGLIEARRQLEQIQHNVLIFQLCQPVWRRWLETAVLASSIQIPQGESLERLLSGTQWQPPGWEYVEPEKDVKAAVRRIRAGLSSRTIEAAKLGLDVEELDRQIAADNARARELGLVFDSDPGGDMDGAARAAAVGDTPSGGEAGEPGQPGQDAA